MAKLRLSLAVVDTPRARPLIEGAVQPEAIDLTTTVASPGDIFWRQLQFADFDVSEMSVSSLLIVLARGDTRWQALPVFTWREFFHTATVVGVRSGIEQPSDLRGKRVGVTEYQQTAALWARGVLKDEFGVAPQDVEWYMERRPELSHGGASGGFTPPAGIRLHYIPPEKSIASMLQAGEIDASVRNSTNKSLLNRGDLRLAERPGVRALFPEPELEGVRYFRKTGILPMNHCVVVRRSILERHPWVAMNLYLALTEAKEAARARTAELVDPYFVQGLLPAEQRRALGADPHPYGVAANRLALETAFRYSHEEGLTPRLMKLDEVFAPSMMAV